MAGKIYFVQLRLGKKNENSKIVDNFSDMLTLECAGRQTDQTRSTFRRPLKTLGFKQFKLAVWRVGGIKIERIRARYFIFADGQGNFLLFGLLLGKEERYWDGP